jgi:membrane fusion protein, heavy metal efflux system
MKHHFIYIFLAFSALVSLNSCGKHSKEESAQKGKAHTESDHDHEGRSHGEENSTIVEFSKEQASKVQGFLVETVTTGDFHSIVKTSGQITSSPGDEAVIVATSSGLVNIINPSLVEGMQVKQGQTLFSISGDHLGEDNVATRTLEARTRYEAAKTEYERAQALIKDIIISATEFRQIKLNYEQAKLAYEATSKGVSGGKKIISAPMTGYVKDLLVQAGQYVELGQKLAVVCRNNKLILRADVSQRYLPQIQTLKTATFTTPYDGKTYELEQLKGRLLSFGKTTNKDAFYTPVNFEFVNPGGITEGSFVEVYLKSEVLPDVITTPVKAVMEDQGHYYVFVQHAEGEYEKREIQTGDSDGIRILVKQGIKAGEKMVVGGAYSVKLASQAGTNQETHQH